MKFAIKFETHDWPTADRFDTLEQAEEAITKARHHSDSQGIIPVLIIKDGWEPVYDQYGGLTEAAYTAQCYAALAPVLDKQPKARLEFIKQFPDDGISPRLTRHISDLRMEFIRAHSQNSAIKPNTLLVSLEAYDCIRADVARGGSMTPCNLNLLVVHELPGHVKVALL
jgi:hypothetical protein